MQGVGLDADSAKALGAYYTDVQVADFLVRWAVRQGNETVLDPSFGGGVFLRSACKRLLGLGGLPGRQVFGVELDQPVHKRISEKLADEFAVNRRNLRNADFFSVRSTEVDVVVGNPPFIRYQRFKGEARERAKQCAAEFGIRISDLSSSWLPFLLHSISQLRPGGRLAMVIPVELTHAAYARPALEALRKHFRSTTILTFRKKLFPDLSEDTLLVLAEQQGAGPGTFRFGDLSNAGALADLDYDSLERLRPADAERLVAGQERAIEQLISPRARTLYRRLKDSAAVRPLGAWADVGIGYVTGANDYFHLSPEAARAWRIPAKYLRPAVRRGRALSGAQFTEADWQTSLAAGETGFLLRIAPDADVTESLRAYLRHGEAAGVHEAYKCRVRKPWYSVPHVYEPDGFLSYMSGYTPRFALNAASAVAPNSLHIIRFHEHSRADADLVAAAWHTSLTRLSVEIEGHALGGGMLKLEPTEAERVLVASPPGWKEPAAFAGIIDRAIRERGDESATALADEAILQKQLGLSARDCRLLREAADTLRDRRYRRGPRTEE